MICQNCGVEAATKYVSFHQNIGVLVMRFSKSMQGNLCKSCIHRYFWQFTSINAVLGWWGMLSLVVTPLFILNNVARYLVCLGMEPVAAGAVPPELTEEVAERIAPHTEQLFQRLAQQEPFERVVDDVALRANVSPGQVCLYVQAVAQAMEEQP